MRYPLLPLALSLLELSQMVLCRAAGLRRWLIGAGCEEGERCRAESYAEAATLASDAGDPGFTGEASLNAARQRRWRIRCDSAHVFMQCPKANAIDDPNHASCAQV